jgi:hypothetical protein
LPLVIPGRLARAVDPSETLLPATTKAFVSVTNYDQLSEQWAKTQLGQLAEDPVMKPFADDLRAQLTERLFDLRRRLGLTLDDLSGVAAGEVSVSLNQVGDDQTAVVLLVDVTGRLQEAQGLLDTVSRNMAQEKAKERRVRVGEAPGRLYDLPPLEQGGQQQQTIYVLKGNLLAASDNVDVMVGVLARVDGKSDETLADLQPFRQTMARCEKDAGQTAPHVRWFVDPFGYAQATRAATPEEERSQGKTTMEQLEAAGFDAIQGMGGFVDLAVDGYEALHRTAVYAPKPHEKSMKMLVLPNTAVPPPPAWIPRDVATYTVLSCDLLNAFDHFGPLFDQVAGDGDPGVWEDMLESMRTQEDGPLIDLRKELFQFQDNQAIMVTDYVAPITPTSERTLYAIRVSDVDAVAKAMKKTQSIRKDVRRHEFKGHVIWEEIPIEERSVQEIDFGPRLGFDDEEEELQDEAPRLPNMSITVAHGYWLIASHYDFLLRFLEPIDQRQAFGRSIDYRIVESMLKRMAPPELCVFGFSRTDEEYRPSYELMRQGKMPQSEGMLVQVLNTLLAPDQKGAARKQEIDGSKAPDYDSVRRYLGPAGTFAVSEEDGWFFKGLMLSKETR